MKKILLVAPAPLRFDLTQDLSYLNLPFTKPKGFLLPLHIATIAGLTPEEFEVDLWDESVQGWINEKPGLGKYDLVGITGYTAHLPRAKAIAQVFQNLGIHVAVGGAGVSTMPQRYRHDFDVLFLGEAEVIWPRFLADWKNGDYRRVYRQIHPVDLAWSPVPCWDSIADQIQNYYLGGVQTSRGCPFDCEFCDVSLLFGRRFRHKPIGQVLQEVSALERFGIKAIVFCDDNFIGNPRYSKELLRELISLNNSYRRPLSFATEVSMNIADDAELLELFADANFVELFVGIESPNKESLKETNKLQNYRRNLTEDVKKVQSYGISVRGSLIVGFDHDDGNVFDQHFEFVQESCLTVPSIRVLMAPPGTKLWERLCREERLVKTYTEGRYFGDPGTTNIIPKRMTRVELHSGYLSLIEKVYDWENFATRIKGFVSNVKRRPKVPRHRQWKRLFQFACFLLSSTDRKTLHVILDIVRCTCKYKPFLLTRVLGIIMRQYGYTKRPKLQKAIQHQIDQEKSEAVELEIERCKTLIPESFRGPYEEIFPKIYEEVVQSMADKTRAEETLVEIFTEFLNRRGHTLDIFSEEDRKHLMQLANRIISEKNRAIVAQYLPSVSGKKIRQDLKTTGLSHDILRAVEDELRMAES